MSRRPTPANDPLVSVVMPVHNAERYVADAARSILGQTYRNLELLVVLDCPTDGSEAELAAAIDGDMRVSVVKLPHRSGSAVARNAGISAARGEYVAHIDHDDIALPQRLEIQIARMQATGADVCGGCVQVIDGADAVWWFPESPEAIRAEMLFRCALLQSTAVVTAAVAMSNPYDPNVSVYHDYDLWTRLAPRYQLTNVQQIVARYRRHGEQDSARRAKEGAVDTGHIRERYFFDLFPDASTADYSVIAAIAEKKPQATIADLERAGEWLVRLARVPDEAVRRRMGARWLSTCLHSAHLGMKCYRLYCALAREFGPEPPEADRLKWQCAFRIRSGTAVAGRLHELANRRRGQSRSGTPAAALDSRTSRHVSA